MRLLLFLFLVNFFSVQSQNIQVVEEDNRFPIAGVAVYNSSKDKSGITDFDGYVEISKFYEDEEITFQHISYTTVSITKSEILSNGNIVVLGSNANALDEIVLSVAKFAQSKKDIPQKINSITSDDISFRNPQTSADLLKSSGSVFIQKSQLGGGSPLIRGFSTNRLLIAVDGVRFNTAIFRGGNVQNVISIDPFAIERTEVVLGPGSVVYGSDAMGGVMNFYTKKPKFSFVDGISFSGNATARYSSASNEKTGHLDFNIGLKEWSFLTSASYTDFDDLRMGSNGPDDFLRYDYQTTLNGEDITVVNPKPKEQVNTGYDQINLMQKIRYMHSDSWDFNLGLFYTATSRYPRYDRLTRKKDEEFRAAVWDYSPQEWINGNLQISNVGTSFYDKSIFTLSYQKFTEGRIDRDYGEIEEFETKEVVDAYTAALDFTKKLGKTKLFYGVEYVNNLVNSEGKQTDITTGEVQETASRYPDGSTWQSIAAYGSLQWKFSEKASLLSGLRYNHILVDAEFDSPFYDFPFSKANIDTGALTGSIGITWQPSKILGWKTNFSTAFRAPNIDDVGKIFDSEPGSVVVPNPDLEAEYAYNYEIGATLNFDDVVELDITAYYTYLKDALVRRDFNINGETEIEYQGELSNVQAIQNASEATIYGFEAGLKVNFSDHLNLTSSYSITDGSQNEEDGTTSPIRHAAPQFGNSHLIWKGKKLKLDAFAEYSGGFNNEELAISQQNSPHLYALDTNGNPYSPSWYTLNLGAEYKFTKAIRANVTLENLTDQRYRTYSSGIAAAGRNFIVALSYSF